MSGYWFPPDDYAIEPAYINGSAHSVSSDPGPQDKAEMVHKIAEEVSGKEIPKKPVRRIGF